MATRPQETETIVLRVSDILAIARNTIEVEHVYGATALDRALDGVDLHNLVTTDYGGVYEHFRIGLLKVLNDMGNAPRATVVVRPTVTEPKRRVSKRVNVTTTRTEQQSQSITVRYLSRELDTARGRFAIIDMTEEDLSDAAARQRMVGTGALATADHLEEARRRIHEAGVKTVRELEPSALLDLDELFAGGE